MSDSTPGDGDLSCRDLPSHPQPALGRVLVTGATGYIGGRLVPELLARGYRVRAMVRAPSPEHRERWPTAEVVAADALDPASLRRALDGVEVAYYLIHSLLVGAAEFETTDVTSARNFHQVAEACGVRRIIYLGGLGDVRTQLSSHLRSRMQVADELMGGQVATTVIRAAIIIGSGSASYEILHHLVRRMLVFPIPSWSRTRCQPIAIRDVIRYLVGVLEMPESAGKSYDIGGPEILSYEMMLRGLAATLGKRRLFFRFPFSHLKTYSYIAGLLTPVPEPIVTSLMEGIRNDVVCQDDAVRRLLPFRPLSYKEAIVEAMTREEQDAVHTRWSDSYPPAHELAIKLHELAEPPRYTTTHSRLTPVPSADVFAAFCAIGGKRGWFHGNWMWRLRGALDRILLGVGTSRGRRSSSTLRVNDVIDFWRVEQIVPGQRLLLRAEMKLPGRGWLEFRVTPTEGLHRLSVTAHYDTGSLAGAIYWYVFMPFHWYLFDNLLKQIDRRAQGLSGP